MSTLAQRYAVSAFLLDDRIDSYRQRADSHEAVYWIAVDMLPTAHTDLAGMLAVAVRREARRRNGLRSVRRRAVRSAAVARDRAIDAEIALGDALDERDALRAELRARDEADAR